MKNWLKNLNKAKLTKAEIYTLFLPIFVWFSYFPNIHFGQINGANVELSLILIYLVGFALINSGLIFKNRKRLIRSRPVILVGIFVAWSILSLIWTINLPRGLMTVAVILVLYGSMLAFVSMKRLKFILLQMAKVYLVTAVIVSLIAIFQVIYGAWTDWGICRACGTAAFGFVRPGVFAIEPQFLGSLLIAPILIFIWQFFKKNFSWLSTIGLGITTTALYLTLSRGAIYALIAGFVLIAIVNWRQYKRLGSVLAVLIVSICVGMGLHATATQLNPNISDGFYNSVSKSVNHLSMGFVELPKPPEVIKTDESDDGQKAAIFDGYVERSTNERVNMAGLSLDTWAQDRQTIAVGVGLGGTGVAVLEHTNKTGSPAEITQNQYIETLLELGLIGLALFATIILGLIYRSRHNILLVAMIVAYMLQWNMFSGYPNALHVYLVLIAIYCYGRFSFNTSNAKRLDMRIQ